MDWELLAGIWFAVLVAVILIGMFIDWVTRSDTWFEVFFATAVIVLVTLISLPIYWAIS